MNLIRYTPTSWLDTAFNRLFEDMWNPPALEPSAATPAHFAPRVEVREEKDAIVVSAEMPGMDRDNVKVELENGVLTLSGEKKQESETKENGIFRSERLYGQFRRSFTLPDAVDPEKIDAEYKNGVLQVWLHKKPEAAPKKISVRGENEVKKIGVN